MSIPTVQVISPPALHVTVDQTAVTVDVIASPALVVEVGPAPGPPGSVGPPGGGGSYLHTQTTPTSMWVVQHGLQFNPEAVIRDTDGNQVLGFDTTWPSAGIAIHTFPRPIAGTALEH